MRYVLLIYLDESRLARMPTAEAESVEQECASVRQDLAESGRLLALQALHASATATTVRVRDGHTRLSDGPCADAGEQLVGLYIVGARDLNEAIRVAAGMPHARIGSIEVRPLRDLPLGTRARGPIEA